MNILDIFSIIVLILSFLDGLKQGAVKTLLSLAAFVVSIPLTGILYKIAAAILSFLPGDNWQNFVGFFITLAVMNALLGMMFILPRMVFHKLWGKGRLSVLLGGVGNLLNSAVGFVLLALVMRRYPIFGWFEQLVVDSKVLNWLMANLRFVETMLPDEFEISRVVLTGLMKLVK